MSKTRFIMRNKKPYRLRNRRGGCYIGHERRPDWAHQLKQNGGATKRDLQSLLVSGWAAGMVENAGQFRDFGADICPYTGEEMPPAGESGTCVESYFSWRPDPRGFEEDGFFDDLVVRYGADGRVLSVHIG